MCWQPLFRLPVSLLVLAILSQRLKAVAVDDQGPPADIASITQPQLRLTNQRIAAPEQPGKSTVILLENAVIDTLSAVPLAIPPELRAAADPGAWLVQCRGPISAAFRKRLAQERVQIIAYIPNQTFLVLMPPEKAAVLGAAREVQAVLPWEPYYKLKSPLLAAVLNASPLPGEIRLRVLVFPSGETAVQEAINTGAGNLEEVLESPFGKVLVVRPGSTSLSMLAQLPGVHLIEPESPRVFANDLSRARLGIAANSMTTTNYLGLTGTNQIISVNDSGVDASHPGLAGRVSSDSPGGLVDPNGHGTHVAGIIAGDGRRSAEVLSVSGSPAPFSTNQFRGMAPAAHILALQAGNPGSLSDRYLQQTAARTNALIANHSWHYQGAATYDLASASYDAAVRDALPGASGASPMTIVFAAGNDGNGDETGACGVPGTIDSPATAKNVITVGAVENFRLITNQTWTCVTHPEPECSTNRPWLESTDSSNRVCSFSSRGNVGIGLEGTFGRFKPDLVAPGSFIVSARSAQWVEPGFLATDSALTNYDANYAPVWSNLNSQAGPFYRLESGTSLAAGNVSGTLALMREFFTARRAQSPSPALLKALLVNGARSLGGAIGFAPRTTTNSQGWGLVNLPASLPPTNTTGAASMLCFEQSAGAALATGEAWVRRVEVGESAAGKPLRITLAWTDPAANPLAAVKLVNDLDLVVTNLDTGAVYFGNDFLPGQVFTAAWDGSNPPRTDAVNNLENVFLATADEGAYSIAVRARAVNVIAVSAEADRVAQDYALVVSSDDAQIANALSVVSSNFYAAGEPLVATLANSFAAGSAVFGTVLTGQRVGAHPPILETNLVALPGLTNMALAIGITNQWRFYAISNATDYTNFCALTFLASPSASSVPDYAGVSNGVPRLEADIDLYVSTNADLTNLDAVAIAEADRSLSRGGAETIVTSLAQTGWYYLAVKCESRMGADFGIAVAFSEQPFSATDQDGNLMLSGFPALAAIPATSASAPAVGRVFAVTSEPVVARRTVVTDMLSHSGLSNLVTRLEHSRGVATLLNAPTEGSITNLALVFDDAHNPPIPDARDSAGPGTLLQFGGRAGGGQWGLTLSNTVPWAAGTNEGLNILLDPQRDLFASAVMFELEPGSCREEFLNVPLQATNLAVILNLPGAGPITASLERVNESPANVTLLTLTGPATDFALVKGPQSDPPLNRGLYVLRVCNPGTEAQMMTVSATLDLAIPPKQPSLFVPPNNLSPIDDALSTSKIHVSSNLRVAALEVGLGVEHPRLSDLAFSLVSPAGTRVTLMENRGGPVANGLGYPIQVTNSVPVSSSGGPQASTNVLDTGQTGGTLAVEYEMYNLPDTMRVYYEGNRIFDSGLISGVGATNINYGPGASQSLTIVMNEGGNFDTNTAWFYTATWSHPAQLLATFTENTDLTATPIKLATSPFTNTTYIGPDQYYTNVLFYLPEESLERFAGEFATGDWTLEVVDARAGPGSGPPPLLRWQLAFWFEQLLPTPVPVDDGVDLTNVVRPGQTLFYSVSVPAWVAFATNRLYSASAPLTLWFSQYQQPTGTNAGDLALLSAVTDGTALLGPGGIPPLVPGATYFLGIQNTNAAPIDFSFGIDFDAPSVPPPVALQNGVAFDATDSGLAGSASYYRFKVSPNAVRAQFEILGASDELLLVARKGPPLPSATSYDYKSDNPGTNSEQILLFTTSSPVPLSPGDWFLTAIKSTADPVSYNIKATEYTSTGYPVAILGSSVVADTFCLSFATLPGAHYYVTGTTNLQSVNWTALSETITADGPVTTWCLPLPSPFQFFRMVEGLVMGP